MRIQRFFSLILGVAGLFALAVPAHADLTRAQELFDAAPGQKEFFLFKDGDHNCPRPRAFYERMAQFIQGQR